MSRTISAALESHLDGAIMFLANMILLTRLDGEVFGFTSHDQPLTFDDVEYEALTSVDASEIRQSAGGGVDNLQLVGLLRSDRITDTDIRAGLYDGAEIALFIVNWADLTMGRLLLLTGTIGEISHRTGEYTAEIRSLSQRLAQQIVELTSPTCRVRALGDERCLPPDDPTPSFDIEDFRHVVDVAEVVDLKTLVLADDHAAPYFRYGRCVMQTGANAGLEREIKEHEADTVLSGAADFEGTNSESLSVTDNAEVSTGNIDFTLVAWAKLESITGFSNSVAGKFDSGSSSNQEYGLRRADALGTPVWRWQCTSAFNDIASIDSAVAPATGSWVFLAGWHDAANNLIGFRVDTTTATTGFVFGVRDGSAPFRIGANENGDFFDGLIGPVRLYKKVLTSGELDAEYNAGVALLYDDLPAGHLTDLSNAWDLDELSDGTAPVTRVDSHGTSDLTDNNTVASGGGLAVVTASRITLQEAFPFAVEVGDEALVEAGCDRTPETCRVKFSNLVNFQGEPHIPGVDQIQERGRR